VHAAVALGMARAATAILFLMLIVGAAAYFVVPEVSLHNALQTKPLSENPKHPSIVMLGDSHTEFPNWAKLLNCNSVANFGVGGEWMSALVPIPDSSGTSREVRKVPIGDIDSITIRPLGWQGP
jgi:hypothetical protein